jgi:hypothetical protein
MEVGQLCQCTCTAMPWLSEGTFFLRVHNR